MGKNYISSVRVVMATDSEPVNSFSLDPSTLIWPPCKSTPNISTPNMLKTKCTSMVLGRGRNSTPNFFDQHFQGSNPLPFPR